MSTELRSWTLDLDSNQQAVAVTSEGRGASIVSSWLPKLAGWVEGSNGIEAMVILAREAIVNLNTAVDDLRNYVPPQLPPWQNIVVEDPGAIARPDPPTRPPRPSADDLRVKPPAAPTYTNTIPDPVLPAVTVPTRPADPAPIVVDPITDPAAPPSLDTGDINLILPDPPAFEGQRPTVTIPTAPGAFTGERPLPLPAAWPEAPTVSPFIPSDIRPLPELSVPVFSWAETPYDSGLLQALNARLLAWVNGEESTGLSPAVETALWTRARNRANAEAGRARQTVLRQWSAAGWNLPGPSLANAVLQAEQMVINANLDASRDIAIEQAKLEQSNRQFFTQQAMQLETQLMTMTSAMRQRLLEAQRAQVELAVQTYNLMVTRSNAEVAILNARAEVWKVENSLQFEAVKVVLERERAKVETFGASVQAYAAEVQAHSAQWDAWAKGVNASLWQLEQYKTDATVFNAKVEAFKGLATARTAVADSQIRLKSLPLALYAEVIRGYSARLEAVKTKADLQLKQVTVPMELYKIDAAAFEAQSQAQSALSKLAIELKRLPAEVYEIQTKAFDALVRAEAERVKAVIGAYAGDTEAYRSQVSANATQVDSDVKISGFAIEADIKRIQAQLQTVQTVMAAVQGKWSTFATVAEATGKIAGNLAASALSSINLGASVNTGDNTSVSDSTSRTESTSSVNSTQTSTAVNTNTTIAQGGYVNTTIAQGGYSNTQYTYGSTTTNSTNNNTNTNIASGGYDNTQRTISSVTSFNTSNSTSTVNGETTVNNNIEYSGGTNNQTTETRTISSTGTQTQILAGDVTHRNYNTEQRTSNSLENTYYYYYDNTTR